MFCSQLDLKITFSLKNNVIIRWVMQNLFCFMGIFQLMLFIQMFLFVAWLKYGDDRQTDFEQFWAYQQVRYPIGLELGVVIQ